MIPAVAAGILTASDGTGRGVDRLGTAAAAVLEAETPQLPQHVGMLLVLAPPDEGFAFARFVDLVRASLHRAPRLRQVVAPTPLELGPPAWVDDADLDLAYHVRHAALPAPGTTGQLTDVVARLLARPLDRERPLWEAYVIDGLAQGRIAVFVKTHQVLVDAVDGCDLASLLLATTPDAHATLPPPEPWEPRPAPSGRDLAVAAVRDLLTSPREAVNAGRRLAGTPVRVVAGAVEAGRGVADAAIAGLGRPGARAVLGVPPGHARRFALERLDLDRVRAVKNAFDVTVNDVVLAMVADALGRFLRLRGVRTDGLHLDVVVPLAMHAEGSAADTGAGGEALALADVVSAAVSLPVGEMDTVDRLRRIATATTAAAGDRAMGARVLMELTGFAPPGLHGLAARVAGARGGHDVVVSNAPGPTAPRWLLGARVVGAFPSLPLGASQALSVAVTSIDGGLHAGLTADWDALPDVDVLPAYLVAALDDLQRNAEAADTRGELARRPTPNVPVPDQAPERGRGNVAVPDEAPERGGGAGGAA